MLLYSQFPQNEVGLLAKVCSFLIVKSWGVSHLINSSERMPKFHSKFSAYISLSRNFAHNIPYLLEIMSF